MTNNNDPSGIEKYRLTPIPQSAITPVFTVFMLWMVVIFSPFIAFAVNGKVDDSNWMPAYLSGGPALTLIIFIFLRTAINFRKLPKSIRDEYTKGKLFDVLETSDPSVKKDYKLNAKTAILSLDKDGVCFSPAALLSASYKIAKEYYQIQMLSELGDAHHLPIHSLPWLRINEWEVHTDSDSPDYYRIRLRDGDYIRLRRASKAENEHDLLDTVRGLGQTKVRIFCDV